MLSPKKLFVNKILSQKKFWTKNSIQKILCPKMLGSTNKFPSLTHWGYLKYDDYKLFLVVLIKQTNFGFESTKIIVETTLIMLKNIINSTWDSIWSLQLKYLKSSFKVYEVFNWIIWSLELKYLISSIEVF